jgi:phage baseplate assembly protein W
MAINLTDFRPTTLDQASIDGGYLYKDIRIDLEFEKKTSQELYGSSQPGDLDELTDGRAIVNSVKNILTTTPGEKLLNPTLGLDFRSFLFEPISITTSYFIAQNVYENLGIQEPRVDLEGVTVEGFPEDNEYRIEIRYSIPNLNIYNLSLNAALNKDGYILV